MRRHDLKLGGAAGDHTIRVYDWGDIENPEVLVCVHGLTRNARDFDVVAEALRRDFRVICPDIAGRGESDWLADPQFYSYETYIGDMVHMLTHFGLERVDWLGTSMGGLIGMMLASTPEPPIRRLILNDIGPWIPKAALQRIAGYLLTPKTFAKLADVEAYFREVHAPFGPLSDEEWAHLAHHGARQMPDGSWCLKYDPAIADPFRKGIEDDADLWEIWDGVRCPVLALRGRESDVLLGETANQMHERGPKARLIEFANIGHAPALMARSQIEAIANWLNS